MQKKILLFISIFFISAVATYFFIQPNPAKKAVDLLKYVKQNNYQKAELALKSANFRKGEKALLSAYIEQAKGKWDLSCQLMLKAFLEAKKTGDKELMGESVLARAALCFKRNKKNDFLYLLEEARHLAPTHDGLFFLEGLHYYQEQDYAEALRFWSQFSSANLNAWYAFSLENLFSSTWHDLHSAHCLIEKGNMQAAREILEKESRSLSNNEDIQQLCALFLGYSYLKEGQGRPIDQKKSYNNMVLFYFEKVHDIGHFPLEMNRIATQLENEIHSQLLTDLRVIPSKSTFDFIKILQKWEAKHCVTHLVDAFLTAIIKQTGEECIRLCETVRNELLGTPFHYHLVEKTAEALSKAIKIGPTEDLFGLWSALESLTPNHKLLAKEFASLTSREIFETIQQDNQELLSTRSYIQFWEKLDRNAVEKDLFAQELLCQAKLCWQNEKQEEKGLHLMEIALEIAHNRVIIEHEISSFLTTLFVQAERSNQIRRLTLIYEAMELFEITSQERISNSTMANHLADAEYLFDAHQYPAAKTIVIWVLKLDPENEKARRLLGLSEFHLGEYHRAYVHLKLIKDLDDESHKAFMLCGIFASKELEKRLCQIDATHTFDENVDE